MNNNTLIIINNTNEKNCCYLPIEYWSDVIYFNKTLKIVACDCEASNRKGQKVSPSLYCQVFKVHTSTGNEIIRVTKATEK